MCYKKGVDITDWDKTAKAFGLNSVKGSNPFWQGAKSVKERTSTFKIYLKLGVENNNGIAGVLQYWS